MKKLLSKEVKIGVAVIITLVVLYVGINFLKGVNIFKPSNSNIVMFDDVTGLTLSSPVLLNGYQVGLVHSMELDQNDSNKIAVTINLNKGIKISKGSDVTLDVSIMGSAAIIIDLNLASKDYYTSTDKIPGYRDLGMMGSVTKTLPSVANLVPKLDSILTTVDLLLSNPGLSQSLENMTAITNNLTVATSDLNKLMAVLNKDVPTLTGNVNHITGDLVSVTGQLKTIDVQSTYKSLDATMKNLEELTQKLNSRDNSLGLLLNDKALYDSLNVTMGNANMLLKDVKQNPSRYINVKVF